MAKKAEDVLPPFDGESYSQAQEIVQEAWDAPSRSKQKALARKALQASPYCIDAYNILAMNAFWMSTRLKLFEKGVEAGRLAFGETLFKRKPRGNGAMPETRSFMQAISSLAGCQWLMEDSENAIASGLETLRLDPDDSMGMRYSLLSWMISESKFEAAQKLLSDFKGDDSPFMRYGETLMHFKAGNMTKAAAALKKALKSNPHVPEFLLDPKKKYVPENELERLLGAYSPGNPSEAESYRKSHAWLWGKTPGAIEWLGESTGLSK